MATFGEVLAVNVGGTASMMRYALPTMIEVGFGRVINFAGGGAASPYPQFSAYATSKTAVVRLSETVAREIAGRGVTLNVISPGAVETDMLAGVRRHGGEIRTTVDMAEPVALVTHLASAAASHINGRFIPLAMTTATRRCTPIPTC